MNVCVVFFSRSQKNTLLAGQTIYASIPDSHPKEIVSISALTEKQKTRWLDLHPKIKISLVATKTDLSAFDFVFFGCTVEGMAPKRKVPDEMLAYLRECRGIEGKKAAIFLPAFGVAGTVGQKIESVLQTRNVKVVDTLVLPYLISLSKEQLEQAKAFAQKALQK